MTGTKNIPIKNLLLHISNVINACDLSSVTTYRLKQYLKYRFKNALPSEDDLDTILKNFIKSVKLSQALNGGSVQFREVNYDSLDTCEAKFKDTMVEYETEDYVLTKEELPKERVINSNIKRLNPYHYALQNLTPRALRNRLYVKQIKKQSGLVQKRKRIAEIMKRSGFLPRKRKRQENVKPTGQKKATRPRKKPAGHKKATRPRKNSTEVLQKKTKRQKKNGPQETVRELSPAEERPQIINKPTGQKKATRPRKKPTGQKKTTRPRKKPTGQKKATRPRKNGPQENVREWSPVEEMPQNINNGPQKNVRELSPAEEKPQIVNREMKPVWNSQVTGDLKLRFKRAYLVNRTTQNACERKNTPAVRKNTPSVRKNTPAVRKKTPAVRKNTPTVRENTPAVRKKPQLVNATARERVTRLNLLSYLQDNFGTQLSDEQLNYIILKTSDDFTAIMKCTELTANSM